MARHECYNLLENTKVRRRNENGERLRGRIMMSLFRRLTAAVGCAAFVFVTCLGRAPALATVSAQRENTTEEIVRIIYTAAMHDRRLSTLRGEPAVDAKGVYQSRIRSCVVEESISTPKVFRAVCVMERFLGMAPGRVNAQKDLANMAHSIGAALPRGYASTASPRARCFHAVDSPDFCVRILYFGSGFVIKLVAGSRATRSARFQIPT